MAKTVDSTAGSLISVGEFLKRCDVRTVADLASDTGSRVGSSTDITAMKSALASDENLEACMLDATGRLEQACYVGGRYHKQDLEALVSDGGAGSGGLYRILTRLIILCLYERRPDREMKQPEIIKQTNEDMQALRDGIEIFPFVETEDAGVMISRVETASQVEARNGTSFISSRLLGRRSNRTDRP